MRMLVTPLKEWMTRSAALFRRVARAVDRAIRRIEDRHRGPLPYMRQALKEEHANDFSSRKALHALARTAPEASRAGLAATQSAARSPADRETARRLKALADELSVLTAAYCEVSVGTAESQKPDKRRDRTEPIWVTGLSRRLARFAENTPQCPQTPSEVEAAGHAITPSPTKPPRPPRPDLP